ncbi:Metal-pseudopaline receptor CntO (plasmid) [Asticcacaulis sp. MM231]
MADEEAGAGATTTVVVTGSRKAAASIKGMDIEPLRLPQNVRVMDEQLISDAGFTKLGELYDLAGGMSRQNSFGGAWDAYAIRGFSGDINQGPDLLINRFSANRGFNARRDVATIERFEVLKGPASALSGKGEPGGSINIVTKAPLNLQHFGFDVSAGSFDTYRGSVDTGTPIGSQIKTRLIAVAERSDGFRDFTDSDRVLVAPSIAYEPRDGLRFLYQAEFNRVNFVHDRGLVAVGGDALALPVTRFLGEPNDGHIHQTSWQHQVSGTYDLSEGVSLEAGLAYRDGSLVGQSTHNRLLQSDGILRRQLRVHDYNWDDLSGRLELSILKSAFGTEHQMRIGADGFGYNQYRQFWRFNPTAANPYGINIYNPVYGQTKPVAPLNTDNHEDLTGSGLFVQDLISIGDQWTVLLGLRYDTVDQTVTNRINNTAISQSVSKTSPRAAITYKPSETWSLYASYGQSFRYNQGSDRFNKPFAPEEGEAFEAGAKFSLMKKKLTGTVSVFDITKDNILATDPADSAYQVALGEARSKGIEIETTYSLNRATYVTGVYTYVDAKVTRDTTAALVGGPLSNIPKHSGAIFVSYAPARKAVGSFNYTGGFVFVGDRPGDPNNSGFVLPSYVTARASIGWQATEKVELRLEGDNLFDKAYVDNSYDSVWVTPGTPRSVTLRLRYGM